MKRKLLVLLAVLCLLTSSLLLVQGVPARLVDDAGLLQQSEAQELSALLDTVSEKYGVDVVIVTVDSTEGLSPMEYADDYYDYGGYAADGILLLVSMEERDWWISTTGYGITAFTDAGIEYISEQFLYWLSDDEYALAFTEFAEQCDAFLLQAETGEPYDSHNLPKEPFAPGVTLIVSVIIGFIAAFIATGIMKGKLKSVRSQVKADDYVAKGSMRLTTSRDLFLYSHVDKREKPKSGSGSSTHVSSSGTTHGGGGGKF